MSRPTPKASGDGDGWKRWATAENAIRYLKFRDGPYWLKAGCDDPENFLGGGCKNYDTLEKRKAAVDYLAERGINSLYMMTNNIDGDDKDVWPWLGETAREAKVNSAGDVRFDVARLERVARVVRVHADQGRGDLPGIGGRQRLARLRSRAVLPRDDRPVRLSARTDLQLQRRVQRELQTAAGAGVHAATRGPRPVRPSARDPQRQHAHRRLHRRAADRLHIDPDRQSRRPRSGRTVAQSAGHRLDRAVPRHAAAAC